MARRLLKPLSVRLTALLSALFVMGLHVVDIVVLESGMRGHPVQVMLSIVVAPLIVFVTVSRVIVNSRPMCTTGRRLMGTTFW